METGTSTKRLRVSYSDADVNRSVANKRLKTGVYTGKVIRRKADVNKKTGDTRLMLTIAPVDEQGNTRKPTVIKIFNLPFPTSPAILEDAGLPLTHEDGSPYQTEVPNTGWDLYNYTKATHAELALPMPVFDGDAKVWRDSLTDAVYRTKQEAQARKVELLTKSYDFFAEAWENAHGTEEEDNKVMIGDQFVFEVTYRAGSDFPNVTILGSECPADKNLISDLSTAFEVAE